MDEFEAAKFRQTGEVDQQVARALGRINQIRQKAGDEAWAKELGRQFATHGHYLDDLDEVAEDQFGRDLLSQLAPDIEQVSKDPKLKELYDKAYKQELEIRGIHEIEGELEDDPD